MIWRTVKRWLRNADDFRSGRYWVCAAAHVTHERNFVLREDRVPSDWICRRHSTGRRT